jgi:hypothetical protein
MDTKLNFDVEKIFEGYLVESKGIGVKVEKEEDGYYDTSNYECTNTEHKSDCYIDSEGCKWQSISFPLPFSVVDSDFFRSFSPVKPSPFPKKYSVKVRLCKCCECMNIIDEYSGGKRLYCNNYCSQRQKNINKITNKFISIFY